MRLLNVKTLKFKEFIGEVGDGIPPYAILSHTWGTEEVSYSDHLSHQSESKEGHQKILRCCEVAESEGFQYVWIDTCCIDKSSSAELSEAINSMFQWYRDAGICYAYLSDVNSSEDPSKNRSSFRESRWFTRGWTLQELLAPKELVFLGSDWVEIGTKRSLCDTVSDITRISKKALQECRWSEYSAAQKMSWAAGRNTTRLEDEAYCLMGLFDVNMPLLYGEGRKAFSRLQQEILKISDDPSIFAWSYPLEMHSHTQMSGLFAPSPEYFKNSSQIELLGQEHGGESESPFQVVNRVVRLRQRLVDQVEAIRLQRLPGQPHLYSIIEIKRRLGTSERQLSKKFPSPVLESIPDAKAEAEIGQIQQPVLTPIITIEIEDMSTEPTSEVSRPSSEELNKIMENKRGGNELVHTLGVPSEDSGDLSSSVKSEGAVALEKRWYSYIYEPAIIVHLRCHIDHHRLGIILSKGSISTDGNILWRLHNPSIVAVEAVPGDFAPPLMTVYANIFTKAIDTPFVWGMEHHVWPEVRIASLLTAGYKAHEDCGPGWEFHSSRAAWVQKRKFQYERDMIEYAPFALFYRTSDDQTPSSPARAFFISIPSYATNSLGTCDLTCEVGVNMVASLRESSFMAWDYDLYSFDLAKERRAEVPLGNGQAVVVKYREGSGVNFVNVSIETLREGKTADPVPHDMSKTIWLRSKIFPMLRSLR
ncbi:uncharacterized protein PAC_20106 [Phialocephala subalpina]|uniref:Heterokaryon incompatibility domain-containing protein n=1 Tax=Phialocephala subalpina TaxID=576137 RepID=A0A1L7XZ22_9HELO|nr:uncharacterized protein PAC_20106 [Phialocephala subalpina]